MDTLEQQRLIVNTYKFDKKGESLNRGEATIARLINQKNDQILQGRVVRLIGANNAQQSMVSLSDALDQAGAANLDLVLVAEESDPPVCRIMNYGKLRYDHKRQARQQKKKQSTQRNKVVKFHLNIDKHDYDIKINRIIEFIKKGFRIKILLMFRGREISRRKDGIKLMQQIRQHPSVQAIASVDIEPHILGRSMNMFIGPLHK